MSAVVDWPPTATAKELKAFLRLAGYYRCFVSRFAKVAWPLTSHLVGIPNDKRLGCRPLSWSAEAQAAFDNLKRTLTEVLAQVQEGKEQVIAYASRSLHITLSLIYSLPGWVQWSNAG